MIFQAFFQIQMPKTSSTKNLYFVLTFEPLFPLPSSSVIIKSYFLFLYRKIVVFGLFKHNQENLVYQKYVDVIHYYSFVQMILQINI